MSRPVPAPAWLGPESFRETAGYIESVQLANGAIPWRPDGPVDPWNHVESAMGLSVAGAWAAAARAYEWLAERQLADGSWWAAYDGNGPTERTRRETNFCAYVATGVWHHYLVTGDRAFLKRFWPVVRAAIGFVLGLQSRHGEIDWASLPDGSPAGDALVTGCASIYKSLECAILIADCLRIPSDGWRAARSRLGTALRLRRDRFDRTWESKVRYAMDWFYPVLTGVHQGQGASRYLLIGWRNFVEEGLGCRCVSDQPWITVAESCELVIALLATGQHARAALLFGWVHRWRAENGGYWMGYQFELGIRWPEEQPTWTAAAVLLAADALAEVTPASRLFRDVSVPDAAQEAQRLHHG